MRKLSFDEIRSRRVPPSEAGHRPRLPVTLVLDNVRSLYNVGSIFRTCDAFFVSGLCLTGFTPFPPRKEIDKTALGATTTVPWTHERDPLTAIAALRTQGHTICALELTTNAIPLDRWDPLPSRIALVVGNEVIGVGPHILDACDAAVDIPMYGTKHSLNVAVACGVALYELSRRLRGR